MWQTLFAELKDKHFTVIAVAMDSAPGAADPWIDAAQPTYPALIDAEHRLAALYHMFNVPQAVWIDEQGTIVRPTECAGSLDGFRKMDRKNKTLPEDVAKLTTQAKKTYANAVRDWVLNGKASEHALDAASAQAQLRTVSPEQAKAHAMFRLGQGLIRRGREDEGRAWMKRASDLHPESWCMWRQWAGKDDAGLAALEDFWERVENLGDRPYHWHVNMKGMPRID